MTDIEAARTWLVAVRLARRHSDPVREVIACSLGPVRLVRWTGGVACAERAFRAACAHGHLDVAQWIVRRHGVEACRVDDDHLLLACATGRLWLARWLVLLGATPRPACFTQACGNGHLAVAQWLDCGDADEALELAAQHGRLETVRWLVGRATDPRDGVRQALWRGHVEVAELLVERFRVDPTGAAELLMRGLRRDAQHWWPEVRAAEWLVGRTSCDAALRAWLAARLGCD